ncbi:gamma-glutamyltransferase [Brevibacterium litoralis]|uniref:gamma-glutamyltransferase n=1 Tax=Brevibacterium litoralis TaxID=3138935 RepID=UPI0032ECAB91
MTAARAVSTAHTLATEAGRRMYELGGNAVDAALAADAVLTVVYPHNTSLGGDLIALVSKDGGEPELVTGFGWAPADVDVESWRNDLPGQERVPARGPRSITVPGTAQGWEYLHSTYASLSWETLLAPAIDAARDGFPLAPSVRKAIDRTARDGELGVAFVEQFFGDDWANRTDFANPALAATYERLAAAGPTDFYTGEVGGNVLAFLQSVRPEFTAADLTEYQVEVTGSLSRTFAGYTVHTGSAPCQGFSFLRYLEGLKAALGPAAEASALSAETVAEHWVDSFAASDTLRDTILAEGVEDATLLDLSLPEKDLREAAAPTPSADGDTVGIAASDENLSISLIQSLYSAFGSYCFDPVSGIVFQNRGAMFSLDPESPQVVSGRRRPPHTLMPVIVTGADGRVALVQSTMGGKGQAQIHARLFAHLVHGGTPAEAVALPRWVSGVRNPGDTPLSLSVEADVEDSVQQVLAAATPEEVTVVEPLTDFMGHANVIDRRPEATGGQVLAASDPRADGSAWVG